MRAFLIALGLGLLSTGVGAQIRPPADDVNVAGIFIQSLSSGDFAAAVGRFDQTMRAALPADRLRSTWERLESEVGAFTRIVGASKVPRADVRIVVATCAFARASVDVQLTFNAAGEISGLFFRPAGAGVPNPAPAAGAYVAPPYVTPAAYTESNVTVGAGTAWPLPATLTMPVGPGPFPALVLVHGSGPQDRDETTGAARPFRDLALGLASRGIAVLRYDKRSRVHGARMAAAGAITVKEEVVDDAVAAVGLLGATPRVDAARVFVLGHSLGGMLIPRIGAAGARIRGFIVLAGAARSIDQAVLAQSRYLAGLDGRVTPEEQKQIDAAQSLADAVAALTPADAASPRMILSAPASYWLDLRDYDAPAAAAAMTAPLLILQGERDYQVTMEDFARWQHALAGNPRATLRSYPALNHLFIAGSGPATPEEYAKPGHVAPEVVDQIATWVAAH
jgi:alpha-beta hydrolase superfamily lysophospholipase